MYWVGDPAHRRCPSLICRRARNGARMVVIVTDDENGGFLGTMSPRLRAIVGVPDRVLPALVVSPLAKEGVCRTTLSTTTTSILALDHRALT